MIFDVAIKNRTIGVLEETLKWNEPAYIPSKTKSGSMVRIDWKKSNPNYYMMYFHCKTNLVSIFKERYGELFVYKGNRAIIFYIEDKIPKKALKEIIELSLTYNLWKG